MTFSVIICTLNRPGDLRECLESIARQTRYPEEIIIVDSSKDDLSRQVAAEFAGALPIKYFQTKSRLTLQRNYGIAQSTAELLLFLDDDVVLAEEFIEEIEKGFRSNDRVAGVGGLLTNVQVKSSLSAYMRKIFLLTRVDGRGEMQKSGFGAFQWCANKDSVQETQILCGVAAYRREVFNEFLYDEWFSGYGLMEDQEFSYRVGQKYRLIYTPFAKAFHKESEVDRIDRRKFFYMKTINHFYIFKKDLRPNGVNWFWFWWSNLGIFLRSFIVSLKEKNMDPVKGALQGNIKIMNSWQEK